jgi:hypothetical protein
VCIAFNIMTGIKMTVYAVQVRCLFLLYIIKVCIFTLFRQFWRKQILMTLYTAAFKNMKTGIFKRAFSSLPFSIQSKEAESFV